MKRQALDDLRAAIEANTEKRSLEQLAAQGKKHVRVVSGDKVIRLIQAIVDDAIGREAGQLAAKDRDRIVSETKQQFDRVLRIQSEQDAVIREQKDLVEEYKSKLEESQRRERDLAARVEADRGQQATREGRLLAEHQKESQALREELRHLQVRTETERAQAAAKEKALLQEQERRQQEWREREQDLLARVEAERSQQAAREARLLAEYQGQLMTMREEQAHLSVRGEEGSKLLADREARLARLEAEVAAARQEREEAVARARDAEVQAAKLDERLKTAKSSIKDYDEEIGRLAEKVKQDAQALAQRETEITRLEGACRSLQAELDAARGKAAESAEVGQLRDELSEMKSFLKSMEQRPVGPDRATMEALLQQIAQRDNSNTAQLEQRFSATMDRTLEEIGRTLRAATAKPLDTVVEATDVLLDKLFDGTHEMESNLERLDVDVRTSKQGIGNNLERLKAMRMKGAGGPAPKPASDEARESRPEAPKAPAPATPAASEAPAVAPPAPDAAPVSDEAKRRMNASMERLKAVREGTGKNG